MLMCGGTGEGIYFFSLFVSQSYDIGKMNLQYAPGPEVQVGQSDRLCESNGYKFKKGLIFTVFIFSHNRPRFCGSLPLFILSGTVGGFRIRLLMPSS